MAVVMPSGEMRVPRFPTLEPGALGLRAAALDRHPFTAPRRRAYYLARNGLWLGAGLLGLRRGDGVLLPAYHCGIEPAVLLALGLTVDFYAVGPDLAITAEAIEEALHPGARAIYVIHYFGAPQDMRPLLDLARARGLAVIEDCALALFSRWEGRPVGLDGAISIFSLGKFLPVPDGGLLLVNDLNLPDPPPGQRPRMADVVYPLGSVVMGGAVRRWPSIGRLARTALVSVGRRAKRVATLRPADHDSLRSEMLCWRMSWPARWILGRLDLAKAARVRERNYCLLNKLLLGIKGLMPLLPNIPAGTGPQTCPILVPDSDRAARALRALGVEAAATWPRPHPAMPAGKFPAAEALRRQVLELPIHQDLASQDLEWMADQVRRVMLEMDRDVARRVWSISLSVGSLA